MRAPRRSGVLIVLWWSSTPCEGMLGGSSLQDAGCLVAGDPGALPREKIGRPFRAPSSGAGGPGALPRAALGSAVCAGGGLSRWGGQRKNGADGTDGTDGTTGRRVRDGVGGVGREWRGEDVGHSLGVRGFLNRRWSRWTHMAGVVGDRKKSSPSCDLRVGFRDDRSRDQNSANRRESSDDGGDLGRHA